MQFSFLVCSERSGSNLITKIVGAHPDYAGPPPSHIIRALALNSLRYGDLSNDAEWQALTDDAGDLLTYHVGAWKTQWNGETLRQQVKEHSQAAIIRHVYAKETEALNKKHVFIKENHAHRFLPFYLQYFPDSKFIWLVRDPRDMALSWRKNNVIKTGIKKAANVWQDDQAQSLLLHGYLKATGKMLLLRYEDLLDQPEESCREICDHLGVAYSPSMLAFHEQQEVKDAASETESWQNLQKPLMRGNHGKYRGELSETEIRYIEACCAEEMAALGYTPDYPIGELATLEAALPEEQIAASKEIVPEAENTLRQKRLDTIARIVARPLITKQSVA